MCSFPGTQEFYGGSSVAGGVAIETCTLGSKVENFHTPSHNTPTCQNLICSSSQPSTTSWYISGSLASSRVRSWMSLPMSVKYMSLYVTGISEGFGVRRAGLL